MRCTCKWAGSILSWISHVDSHQSSPSTQLPHWQADHTLSQHHFRPADHLLDWSFLIRVLDGCAAAAAKSLQSCPTLCKPIDGSPPGILWDSPSKNTGVGCHCLLLMDVLGMEKAGVRGTTKARFGLQIHKLDSQDWLFSVEHSSTGISQETIKPSLSGWEGGPSSVTHSGLDPLTWMTIVTS